MSSEVARIMQQIDTEYHSALLAMNGYAEVARHEVINKKYEQLGELVEELKEQIGTDEAMKALMRVMDDEDE